MAAREERKPKTHLRFNLLDAVLILLAVLCVVGVWQRHNLQKLFASDAETESFAVTFEIKQLRSTTVDLLEKDTAFYLVEQGEEIALGVLQERVSASAATVYLQDAAGNTVTAVYPEDNYRYLLDVNGILTCRGVMSDGTFLLNGRTYLAVNQVMAVYTEAADLEIRITGIVPMA